MRDITLLEKETQIPKEKLEAFRALDSKLNNSEDSDLDISAIQTIIVESLGDMETNKKLDLIAPYSRRDTGIGGKTMGIIKDISYRTRHLNKISNDLDTIYTRFEQGKLGVKLESDERITLAQYGILYDLAHLNKYLEEMNHLGLINGNETLEKLFSQTQKAKNIIQYLDDTFDQSFKMPTGSVVFNNTSDQALIYQKHYSFFEKIINFFITKFSHSSKGVFSKKNNKISHINPTYKEEKLTVRNYLYSDIYKIKLETMISPSIQKILKEKLGNDWLKQLEHKHEIIEKKLHDQAREEHIHITANGSVNTKVKIATIWLQGGHKNSFFANHSNKDIRDNFFGRGAWENNKRKQTKLLCSEFVGMSLIAVIQELNDQVIEELKAKGVEGLPQTIIKNPISQREKLHLLTPERLLVTMQKRGIVEKVETPPEISRFISR
ncbi:uncharacterized protein RVIR1_02300 [Candidatus Rickettsiella viridis]|uniref:Uncharacterized protein n=1 Tax=Candidatus Rickettsiella viridis TaxID=676208 RepID=A0A2Z5UTJ6_9COXI|nr:hypothetical protein [Candidatus Rickettsiella viridis]BBB14764.1 uncharacterized protein RVIR1_02300 [Candidatus Rickettsiella viridis]